MIVSLDINGARVTITGDRLQVSVAEEETAEKPNKQRANVLSQHEVRPGSTSLGTEQQCDTLGVTAGETAPISETIKLAPITVLRPNCLSPDSCAGHGRNHCHRCRKVLAEGEAA